MKDELEKLIAEYRHHHAMPQFDDMLRLIDALLASRSALAGECPTCKRLRTALNDLDKSMRASIKNCCGDNKRFCENYGCGTLKFYLDIIAPAVREGA